VECSRVESSVEGLRRRTNSSCSHLVVARQFDEDASRDAREDWAPRDWRRGDVVCLGLDVRMIGGGWTLRREGAGDGWA